MPRAPSPAPRLRLRQLVLLDGDRTASANARTFAGSLTPGRGLRAARDVDGERRDGGDRRGDVAGVEAAAEDQRHRRAPARGQRPVERLPRPARRVVAVRVEQVVVDVVEATEVLHVGGLGDPRGLDDLGAGAAAHLVAERRALVAVELGHRQPDSASTRLDDLVERRVVEDAADACATTQRAGDQLRLTAGSQRRGEPSQRITPTAHAPRRRRAARPRARSRRRS